LGDWFKRISYKYKWSKYKDSRIKKKKRIRIIRIIKKIIRFKEMELKIG
jgi:hypothetical protein